MTIDEAIEFSKEKARQQYHEIDDYEYDSEEHRQLAEWLEELKALRNMREDIESNAECLVQQGRNDAIDECIGIVNTYKSNWYRDIDGDWVEPHCTAKTLIEKMIELQKE